MTSSQTEVPGLEKVIVYFGGDVVIRDTLQEALTAEFGNAPPTLEATAARRARWTPPAGARPAPSPSRSPSSSRTRQALFDQADAALAAKDLAKYQDLSNQARAKTSQAEQLLAPETSGGAASTTLDQRSGRRRRSRAGVGPDGERSVG